MEEDDTSTMAYNCGGNMGWFYKHWIFSSIKTPHFGEECRKEGQDRYDSVWSCILNPGGYHNETRPNSKSDRGLSVVGSCTGNGRSGKCSSKRMHFFYQWHMVQKLSPSLISNDLSLWFHVFETPWLNFLKNTTTKFDVFWILRGYTKQDMSMSKPESYFKFRYKWYFNFWLR